MDGSIMILNYYVTAINIRQSTNTSAGATVWSFRNTDSTKSVYIKKATLLMAYDGDNPMTNQTVRYSVNGFGIATPSDGTTQTPCKLDSASDNSFGPDIRYLDTGLTVTSVVFGPDGTIISCPAVAGASVRFERISGDFNIRLGPGEGICIKLSTDAIEGISLSGELIWEEV